MLLFSVLFLLLLFLAISGYTYRVTFYASKKKRLSPDAPLQGAQNEEAADHIHRMMRVMAQIPFEPVVIHSCDGLQLFGRYYHLRNGAPVEILFHGYRSCALHDCSGGHALARKMGFNTLVVDQRAHGESDGTAITFGVMERFDCLSWVQYVNQRWGAQTPILLSGLSMGAATVLMAAMLDLPSNVHCIMADSPYSSPMAIIEKVCRDRKLPAKLCKPFLCCGALLFGHFHLNSCSAIEAVSHAKVPILLIHGLADHFVPCQMSEELAAHCTSLMQFHTFPNAGHGLSYLVDPQRYEKVVYDFLCDIGLKEQINVDFQKSIQS